MLSLRDKLKATAPTAGKPKQVKPAPEDCLLRETVVPLKQFTLPDFLSGQTLTLMQGREIPDCHREEICFLDTETTGLSHGAGTVAFLVGVGYFTGDTFVVRQYLMRDYDEEIFLLNHIAGHIEKSRVLCTFNGATFDMPLLESRYTMQRMRNRYREKPHVDLLPISRRVWKLRLKKCNLTSLEEAVLGIQRQDDLPGALVPERYFSFLKTRDFSLLEDILEHNAQDIISLAHILDRLMRLHDAPLLAEEPEDVYSLGKIYEKRGKHDRARMCYRAADQGSMSLLARGKMADSYRHSGDWEAAAKVYGKMIAQRQGGVGPLIAMAKICEHKTKDIPAAIEYTRRAIVLAADRPDSDMPALQKRYQRLMMKARKE
ncbi:MAG: ribonuclease H-like domain-containing protein [Clostridia bacterium]|nr:ribonuclease H-like domain-containing protein [Clostridia bacterium]